METNNETHGFRCASRSRAARYYERSKISVQKEKKDERGKEGRRSRGGHSAVFLVFRFGE